MLWLMAPFSIFNAQCSIFDSLSLSLTSASVVSPPSLDLTHLTPSYKDPCDSLGPTQIVQNNLPISKSLIKSSVQE